MPETLHRTAIAIVDEDDSPLSPEEHSARAGPLTRQISLR